MVDSSPIISSSKTPPIEHAEGAEDEVSISSEELKELSHAMSSLKEDEDRTTLEELKEDRDDYIEVRGVDLCGGSALPQALVVIATCLGLLLQELLQCVRIDVAIE